jgi:hypothetical protein
VLAEGLISKEIGATGFELVSPCAGGEDFSTNPAAKRASLSPRLADGSLSVAALTRAIE